ncbi:hypothetical protein GCM10011371_12730 [Novosphingobium marinum]|uniref:Uncharacterized protein n=1 Tax=Novosphingobium marinum TaxID=1514948 RepID=A0A7Y9XVI1_9SPHN|nr:hypothetical protein [Novosphingobium marinum]NYH95381.1 hypothetical protein [Novosphingobium marinum]GGC26590.1 hypothetical protein GCM10011371_12730 [Novosphingobium marinum]
MRSLALAAATVAALATGHAQARDSLGLYATWGAFRDPMVPRCYAIAKAEPSRKERDYQPFAAIGTWPKRGVRGQIHFRLSREMAKDAAILLRVGDERFELAGGGGDAWATDRKMNAAITAAMRSARSMTVSSRDKRGRRFSNTWTLSGAASAMDAALLGCAKLGR